MEIRENDKISIFAPLSAKLDKREWLRLKSVLINEKRAVALDLSYVQDCTIDFIEGLKAIAFEKKLGIFNIPSDIFVLFNVMDVDKIANLFVSEPDFIDDCRKLINRKFSLI